jgi:hypothetical protein
MAFNLPMSKLSRNEHYPSCVNLLFEMLNETNNLHPFASLIKDLSVNLPQFEIFKIIKCLHSAILLIPWSVILKQLLKSLQLKIIQNLKLRDSSYFYNFLKESINNCLILLDSLALISVLGS